MNFLYYLPGMTYADVDGESLRRRGLADTFRDAFAPGGRLIVERLQVRNVIHNGPDGGAGVLIAFESEGVELGYHRDAQEWRQCGEYWLGYYGLVAAVSPDALQRPTLTPGYAVLLADGNVWEVPTIRRGGRYSSLPQRMTLDAAGDLQMTVLPEFDFAWQASGQIFEHVFKSRDIPFREVLSLCADVLSLNYRVGIHEVSRLGLVTTENYVKIFEAAVDWPKIVALMGEPTEAGAIVPQKKTESVAENANT